MRSNSIVFGLFICFLCVKGLVLLELWKERDVRCGIRARLLSFERMDGSFGSGSIFNIFELFGKKRAVLSLDFFLLYSVMYVLITFAWLHLHLALSNGHGQ
jgi:hypothetical protein